MSRSGTLQDALRVVDKFQRAALPPNARRNRAPEIEVRDPVTQERHRKDKSTKSEARGRFGREKSPKHGRKKSKSDKERRRGSIIQSAGKDGEDSDEYSDEEEELEEKKSSRRKDRGERHRKERKSSSSSHRDSKAARKKEKERGRKRREKEKSKSRRLRSPDDDSSLSEDEDSLPGEKSSFGEDSDSPVRAKQIAREKENLSSSSRKSSRKREKERRSRKRERTPEDEDSLSGSMSSDSDVSPIRAKQVADGIIEEFPDVREDLQQLLQLVDFGQAVDISALPNKRLIDLLKRLFRQLRLSNSRPGVYLLPSGSKPTLERLGWSLNSEQQAKDGLGSGIGQESGPGERGASELGQGMEMPVPSVGIGPAGISEAQKKRVMGPAMPSAEMLEAAARLTEAEEALRSAEEVLDNDPLIGPPPPAAVAEASSANDAERFEEVSRITASDIGDAYDLLGLKRGVTPANLKKRYWKLSLLVHPDKCSHPLAQQAFMALNKAVKDLQDPVKRAEIDRKADEKQAKEEYEADLRAQLEAAQWRKLRGEEALPGDAELLQGPAKDLARDEWMTVLPPERQAGGPPSQQNTFFSRSEKSGRGDTSAWTDTPLEKAEKAKMHYLEAYKQAALTGVEKREQSVFEMDKAARAAALMDEHNQKKRKLSLVEEHQRERVKKVKKAKSAKSLPQVKKQDDWVDNHPWRPWDREKDLAAGRQTVKLTDEKGAGEGLRSRFGSSTGPRNFL